MAIATIILIVILIIVALLSLISLIGKEQKPLSRIPGPNWREIISKFWLYRNEMPLLFCHWAKNFGPIYRLSFVGTDALVLNCPRLMRNALSKQELSGALEYLAVTEYAKGHYGIASADYNDHTELRKFIHQFQRSLSFQNELPQRIVMEEMAHFIDNLAGQVGGAFAVKDYLQAPIVNSIWILLSGQKFPFNEEGNWVADFMHRFNAALVNPIIMFFPLLVQKFPWLVKSWQNYRNILPKVWFFVDKVVKEHVTSFDPEKEDESMDFIEAYLKQMNNPQNHSSPIFSPQNGYNHLRGNLISFLVACGDTTVIETNFIFMRLAHHSNWQETIWREIQHNVKTSSVPTLDDRKKMVKTQAFILETLRMYPVIPFVVHRATHDFSFENARVPKGTFVLGNCFSVHQDPECWPEPEVFKPERFLSPDESQLVKSEALISFGSGKRSSIDQQNALDLIFLYVTHVIQRFTIKFDPTSTIDWAPQFDYLLTAKPYKIILEERERPPK